MITFILFFIGYFFLTATLSKIAEKEEIDWDWVSWFLLLIPPVYFLYITRRFPLMLLITWLTYWIANLLVMKWIPANVSLLVFIIPLLISFAYILYNLKIDLRLNLINFAPPVLWSLFLLIYLAFIYKNNEAKKEIKIMEKNIKIWNTNIKNNVKKSEFEYLNKNLFKSFSWIDYNKVNNEDHMWLN